MRKFFTRLVLAGILFIGVQSFAPFSVEEQPKNAVANPFSLELDVGLNLTNDPGDGGIG